MALTEKSLDMYECSVCNTVNCVGGWYVIAVHGKISDDDYKSYRIGTDAIAAELGFENDDAVEGFLADNPTLWGNEDGYVVFSDEKAYYHPVKRPEGAQTLQHVIDHFEEVRDRSPE